LFSIDEFKKKVQDIGKLEDVAEIRAGLAEISTNVSEVFDQAAEAQLNYEKISEDNEKLRAANMKLFTSLGVDKKPDEEKDPTEPEPEPEKRKFEDLFNEKGELK